MSDRMPDRISDRMPDYMSNRMSEYVQEMSKHGDHSKNFFL